MVAPGGSKLKPVRLFGAQRPQRWPLPLPVLEQRIGFLPIQNHQDTLKNPVALRLGL